MSPSELLKQRVGLKFCVHITKARGNRSPYSFCLVWEFPGIYDWFKDRLLKKMNFGIVTKV